MDHTVDIIIELVVSITGLSPNDIRPDANLYLDLGVASVHAIQLLAELEKRFNVSIPDEEFVESTSIKSLALLMNKLEVQKGVSSA